MTMQEFLQHLSLWVCLRYLVGVWLLHITSLLAYRAIWHPLASYPGPILARVTYLYEFWFDVVLGGRYTREIGGLHAQYGPIIRINPDELHCNDPSMIELIYAGGNRKRDRPAHFLAGLPPSIREALSTADHNAHRVHRAAISKMFSRTQILKFEGMIHENAQKLCDKFLDYAGREPFDLNNAYSCFTTDSVTEFCLGKSTGFLDQPAWEPNYREPGLRMLALTHLTRHVPIITTILDTMPLCIIRYIAPKAAMLVEEIKVKMPQKIRESKAAIDAGIQTGKMTLAQMILNSDLPQSDKTIEKISADANIVVQAGTETTSSGLSAITYYLLKQPEWLSRVRNELLTVVTDSRSLPSWPVLETLPILNATIVEGLRLTAPPGRFARIATDEELLYEGTWEPPGASMSSVRHVVPRGYAIGMSGFLVHSNEGIFPRSSEFLPSRWLDENGRRRTDLNRYLLVFSKGSRQCLGMQLAYCELYVLMAAMVMRVIPFMQLYQTTDSDVAFDHDVGIARPRRDSKGIRVQIQVHPT